MEKEMSYITKLKKSFRKFNKTNKITIKRTHKDSILLLMFCWNWKMFGFTVSTSILL